MSNVLKLSVIAYMPVRGQVYVGYCVIEIGMTWYWRQHSPISLRNGKYVSRISPCMLSTTFTSIFMASSKSTQCSMLLTTAATSDSSHPSSISCRAHCFMSRLFTAGVTSGHHRFKRKFSQNTFSFLHLSSLTHRIIQVLAIQLPIIRLLHPEPTNCHFGTRWIPNVSFAASCVGRGTGGGDRALLVHGSSSCLDGVVGWVKNEETYCNRSKRGSNLKQNLQARNSATTAIVRHATIATGQTWRQYFSDTWQNDFHSHNLNRCFVKRSSAQI